MTCGLCGPGASRLRKIQHYHSRSYSKAVIGGYGVTTIFPIPDSSLTASKRFILTPIGLSGLSPVLKKYATEGMTTEKRRSVSLRFVALCGDAYSFLFSFVSYRDERFLLARPCMTETEAATPYFCIS
jgi:hypothetical protein